MDISIGIVEDHTEFRQGLVFMLEGVTGIGVAWAVGSVREALHRDGNVDVVLLDINLPDISGIEAIPLIKARFSGARIIMLTVIEDVMHIVKAIASGADGYILKKNHPHEIPEAIRHVNEGGAVLTPLVARRVFDHFGPKPARPGTGDELTAREREILSLLIEGMTNEKIAGRLYISQETVRSHIKNIYSKMQVHNRAGIVAKTLQENILGH